jgi:hypothetical protein
VLRKGAQAGALQARLKTEIKLPIPLYHPVYRIALANIDDQQLCSVNIEIFFAVRPS